MVKLNSGLVVIAKKNWSVEYQPRPLNGYTRVARATGERVSNLPKVIPYSVGAVDCDEIHSSWYTWSLDLEKKAILLTH